MLTLYSALLAQHPRQLTSVRCAEPTIVQLHRYFEDVVLENNLAALVVESFLPETQRSLRDAARAREVGQAAHHAFFFVSSDDALNSARLVHDDSERRPVLMPKSAQGGVEERFVVIADARFSALLASVRRPAEEGADAAGGDEVIWTFEPDIVYSALEYLMARVTAELPQQSPLFSKAVRTCVPKTTSLQLTVSVTTKLARLLQEQAVRELAVNRISTAIRSSLELPSVLQTTVNEVGRALGAQYGALSIEGEHGQPSLTTCYFRDGETDDVAREELVSDMEAYGIRLRGRMKTYVHDGGTAVVGADERAVAAVPVIFHERTMGVLMVTSDEPERVWQDNEIMLMMTVADQMAVAVNHARLFQQMQREALTDGLTGCFNRRFFEIQLERDLHLATRMRQPVSLILIDIDHFKGVNDTHGHDAGDAALRILASELREEVRGVDTAARYGGEEFAIILPQAGPEGAFAVAERLRTRIERTEVPGVGAITASLGIATFPLHASSRDLLVTAADRALYQAKRTGRNRVCSPADLPQDDMFSLAFEAVPPGESSADFAHETPAPVNAPAAEPHQEAAQPNPTL
ncbi:MAG TPA: sensor domain-containing diguanylate cyclase [Pyrinomonadaceae bacterium]|jgi:diguanylate cyclase (GGDEF)-like protein|nr:sensor domain-containing diguanylate cyclase [Pyrinomonadaceae bacterium]